MTDDPDDTTYGLVMPFVACVTNGGPYDDEAYRAGWEMGALDSLCSAAAHLSVVPEPVMIRETNRAQADLIFMRHGFIVYIESESTDGWISLGVRPA